MDGNGTELPILYGKGKSPAKSGDYQPHERNGIARNGVTQPKKPFSHANYTELAIVAQIMRPDLGVLLMKTLCIPAAFAALFLSACAPPQTAETAASTETSSTSSAKNGRVPLQSRDAPGLAGKWTGEYVGQNGFRGQTTMTLTTASADSVDGVFEYRWGSGNYDRHPDSGTIVGTIDNGVLNFGSWDLRLEREGEELIFRTEQKIGGFPSKLRWRKDTPPLPSEAVAGSS